MDGLQKPSEEHLRATAGEALSKYAIALECISFLGHGDNATFRVEAGTQTYLLRIHDSNVASLRGDWQSPEVIASELDWMTALSRESDIGVQTPVAMRDGNFIASAVLSGMTVHCTLLTWIKGELLPMEAQRSPEQAAQLGLLMAKLHRHARNWTPPTTFKRPNYDGADLGVHLGNIHTLVAANVMPAACDRVFEATVERLNRIVAEHKQDSSLWGLIHGDLHENNYLFDGGVARPIDFARCGFGFYLFDIGGTLHHLGEKTYAHFFNGYRQAGELPAGYERLVEAFFLWRLLTNFSFLSCSEKERDYLSKAIPWAIERYFNNFLAGKSFLPVS